MYPILSRLLLLTSALPAYLHSYASPGPGMVPAGPHPPVPLNQTQMAQQQAAAHQAELAKRKSRKPTDKSMPDGVEECTIGDGAQRYRDLRDFERRLDATMTRKRLDIMDSIGRTVKVRVFLPRGMPSA